MASVLRCLEKLKLTGYTFKTVSSHRMIDLMKRSCTSQHRQPHMEHSVVLTRPQVKLLQSFFTIARIYRKIRCTPAVDIIDAIHNLRIALDADHRNLQKNHTLLLLRCCGKPTIDILTSERKQLTQEILDLLSINSIDRDILYHNTVLQVMLENDCDFSPSIVLEEIKNDNIEPNQQTYMIILEYYSKKGNVAEANNIVTKMKDLNYTLTPDVYKLLIAAHSESGDVVGAEQILDSMKDINIVPNGNAYTALMCGYAKLGDIENIRRIFTQSGNTVFSNRNFLDVAYALIFNNHIEYVDEVLSCVQKSTSIPMAEIEFIGKLLEIKNFKTSIDIFIDIIPSLILHDHMDLFLHSILCRLMSNAPEHPDTVLKICDSIDKKCTIPFFIDHAINASFKQPNTKVTYKLFEYKMKKHEAIKPHYFWPLFVRFRQSCDIKGVFDVLTEMIQRFQIQPCIRTLNVYIIPCIFRPPKHCRAKLLNYHISPYLIDHAIVTNLLDKGKIEEALYYVKAFNETPYDYKTLEQSIKEALKISENCFHYFLLMNTFNEANINIGDTTDKQIYMTASYNRHLEDNLMHMLNEMGDVKRILSKIIELCWSCNTILTKPVIDRIRQVQNLPPDILDILDMMTKLPNMPDTIFTFLNNLASDKSSAKYETSVIFEISTMNNEALMIDTLKLFKMRRIHLSQKSRIRALRFFCEVNNLVEAQKYIAVINETNNFSQLNQALVMSYVELLISHNAIEEVNKFIKSLWKTHYYKNVEPETKSKCSDILTKLIHNGQVKEANQIFECFKTLNFVQGNAIQCPELVGYYVKHGDIKMALTSFGAICDTSQVPPYKHKLTKLIIEKKEGTALQQMINECVKVQTKRQIVFELIMDLVTLNHPEKALDLYNAHNTLFEENERKYSTMTYLQQYDDNELEALYQKANQLPSKLQSEIYDSVSSVYIHKGDRQNVLALWSHIQRGSCPYSELLKRNVEKAQKDFETPGKTKYSPIGLNGKVDALRT